MPSLYHFNSDQFKENLLLGGQQHMVAGRLCQYLKSWQLDGIRFLYKHFEKGEACILNDESGLGKVVTVSVFLGAILNNDTTKKCLIIVGDDDRIERWRFHLSVLTQLTVKVIERISDINYETVFLIKWSTLKNIGQITKTTFDHIIIDNCGEMLTNKFCTGILLRYYENQITLVISSSDITADVKLLHILLRLCGRLDKQYMDVKAFENKFQLPKLKDSVCNKVDLEDYFLKREKVTNFCREFRLRRYCHQFEDQFPLVSASDFKRHLEQWRNSDNSQSSGSVKLLSSSSEKDIEELFKQYFQVKDERDSLKLDCEVQGVMEQKTIDDEDDHISDDVVVMSPLFFISESESDNESIQVQRETNEKLQTEPREDEESKDMIQIQFEEAQKEKDEDKQKDTKPIRNRRKATKPIKSLPQKTHETLHEKSLRSRSVPNVKKPSPALSAPKKLIEQKTTNLGDKNSKTTDRKIKVNVLKNAGMKKEPNNEKLRKAGRSRNTVEEIPNKDDKREKKQDSKAKEKKNSSGESVKLKKRAKDDENIQDNAKASKKISSKPPETKSLYNTDAEKTIGKPNTSNNEEQRTNKVGLEHNEANDKKEMQKKTKTKPEETKIMSREKETEPTPHKEAQTHASSGEPKSNRPENNLDKTKQAKEKENEQRRSTHRKQKHRAVQLSRVLLEAKKFLNNKHNTSLVKNGNLQRKSTARSTRTSGDSNSSMSASTPNIISAAKPNRKTTVTRLKTPEISSESKPLREQKPKPNTPKRSSTFTVYTPLGVHSRTTRGMQRHTRTYPTKNKYMQIAIAQVSIDKKSSTKRTPNSRKSVSAPKVEVPPPQPPLPLQAAAQTQVPLESPAIIESMQLGQALTPTNGMPNTEFIAPPQKKVDYNFPLMLDKEIAETECILASQNNNANEIIILTGSSTTIENEMEPPKCPVPSRRKAYSKPPMVTIPRLSYNRAKSPDLFSICSDLSLPCSQQNSYKSNFEGFKLFGSELRKSGNSRSCLDILERMLEPKTTISSTKKSTPQNEKPSSSPQQHCIDDEDAMFEITSNCTFGNVIRVNSNGEVSPTTNKRQSTPPITGHPKNRITNYLISNNQPTNTAPSTPSLEDAADLLQKTPKRRKSLSGTVKRSPKGFNSTMTGGKSQSTKLTQWLVKHSSTPLKPPTAKRRRLELSFRDD